ncbi:MAG: hypothetical protein ACW98J_04150 [Candidatus Thorarchaeota archaeon]
MSGFKNMGLRELLVVLWIALMISALVTQNTMASTHYGASSAGLEAGKIEVSWWNAITTADEILVLRYDAELGPIDIYVVSQTSYNLTSGEVPISYHLHHHGNSTELQLNGPLQQLYFVVVSEIDQNLYQEAWTYSSAAMLARTLYYPIIGLLVLVSGVYLVWYWRTSSERMLDSE